MSDEMIELILESASEAMASVVSHARKEFASVRTGRASAVLVEKLPVEYYGTLTPMQQLASFSVPEARTLVISPFDKSSLGDIERAIMQSDLGLNPSNDGQVLRLTFPQLTQERRKELVKVVKAMAEDGRVGIRNSRRAAKKDLDALEKDGDISEDDLRRAEKELDKITQGHEQHIDEALAEKEQELLEV